MNQAQRAVEIAKLERSTRSIGTIIGDSLPNGWGFALAIFEFGDAPGGHLTYISSADRAGVSKVLREMLARWDRDGSAGERITVDQIREKVDQLHRLVHDEGGAGMATWWIAVALPVVHLLHHGEPLCRFTKEVPRVSVEDHRARKAFANCDGCLRALPLPLFAEDFRALTLWQPWDWLVGTGIKRIENRKWAPPLWLIGRYFAIHAGVHVDQTAFARAAELGITIPRAELHPGHVVAVGRLKGVTRKAEEAVEAQRRWWFGPYGWVLDDLRRLPKPVPCWGFQGLWRVPTNARIEIEDQDRSANWRSGLASHSPLL